MTKTIIFLFWIIVVLAAAASFFVILISSILKKPYKPPKKKIKYYSISEIEATIQNKTATKDLLAEIIDSFIEYHPIPPKVNGANPKDAKKLLDMIFTLSGHTNMDNTLRQNMFDRLIEANPAYKIEFKRGI